MKGLLPCLQSLILGSIVLLAGGCDSPSDTTNTSPRPQSDGNAASEQKAESEKLWSSAAAAIQQSQLAAKALQLATQALLTEPSRETLAKTQAAWIRTALTYGKFYFFSELSVIDPEGFQLIHEHHFRVAGSPIQPGYLDTFGPYQYSGLVHDISVELEPENLLNQNGLTDLSDVCLGLYAIEYMLFGENKARKFSDYQLPLALTQEQLETGFQTIEETPAYRRRKLLKAQTMLLTQDLDSLYPIVAPKGIIDSTVWQSNTKRANAHTLKTTLERSLTQLLVKVIELQKNTVSTETPNEYQHGNALNAAEQAQQLANELESTASAQGFINKPELFETLSVAQSEIARFIAEPLSAPPWQALYTHIKTAIDLLKDNVTGKSEKQ